jgi:hypothetical protein
MAVSHQLRVRRDLGLVAGNRNGRQVVYELFDSHVASLLDAALRHLDHLTNDRRGHSPDRARHNEDRHDMPTQRERSVARIQTGAIVQTAEMDADC